MLMLLLLLLLLLLFLLLMLQLLLPKNQNAVQKTVLMTCNANEFFHLHTHACWCGNESLQNVERQLVDQRR